MRLTVAIVAVLLAGCGQLQAGPSSSKHLDHANTDCHIGGTVLDEPLVNCGQQPDPDAKCKIGGTADHPRADRKCTPGLRIQGVQHLDPQLQFEFCTNYNHTPRRVTSEIKRQVANDYGLRYQPSTEMWKHFEFDHLVPRNACGADDPRNIWPEPHPSTNVKDVIEYGLYDDFKAGRVTSGQVRLKMLRDWSYPGGGVG